MSKHTPGKWKPTAGTEVVADTGDGNWQSIAMLNVRRDEWIANARLIAAAPELLETCEALATFTRDLLKLLTPEQIKAARLTTRMVKLNDKAFNTLAKARGEQ